MIKLKDILFESVQRGSLYHIFDLSALLNILKTDELSGLNYSYISTTRNKLMNSFLGSRPSSFFKLELDGDKLSEKYKIKPFSYQSTEIDNYDSRKTIHLTEYEEVILTSKIVNISKYVKRIILIKDTVENMKKSGWFDSDGGRVNSDRVSFPAFLHKYRKDIEKKFGPIYVQSGSIISRDDKYIDLIENYSVKKIVHGYGAYIRKYIKKKENKYGNTDILIPLYLDKIIEKYNESIEEPVIGYDYKNLKLFKSKADAESVIKKNINLKRGSGNGVNDMQLYIADFEIIDIIDEDKMYLFSKSAKLVDLDKI